MTDHGWYINGEWSSPSDVEWSVSTNPSDFEDHLGRFARGDGNAVDRAVCAAAAAQPGWFRTSPQTRANLLERVASAILDNVEELGTLLSREEGKTLAEAKGEVTRAGQLFRFFSGEALRMTGEIQQSTREGVEVAIRREPVGVVGVVTPWNFPIAIPAWKIAPALAFGNSVVWKPAELVPAMAHALTELIHRAGFPRGVFNMITGPGSKVGDAIVVHPTIDAITFTGSERVGRGVATAAAARLASVQLEMGGKNALVVLADADLEIAVQVAIDGAYVQTGQRCTASSRLIVESSIHDRFVEAMIARLGELRVGPALDPRTDMGPVVSAAQLATDERYLELARASGATVYGGERLARDTRGHFLSPALIVGGGNDDVFNREEIFGPVAGVIEAHDYEEALRIANDTPFGLASGIVTTSLRHASDFQHSSTAGIVMVNLPTAGVDPHVPFGGRKGSSYGPREQGTYARQFFTQTKTAYVRA